MWKFVGVPQDKLEDIATYLKWGYEPFAVSTGVYGFITIWLKVKEEDEIPDKPDEPVKGRSRRTTKKS